MEQSQSEVAACTSSFSQLTDCVIMQHLVQENLTRDLRQVSLMGEKTERELMIPEALTEKQPVGSHKPSVAGADNQPLLDIKAALTRGDANDHRAQTRLVTKVKQACLEFRTTPIDFH